VLVTLLMALANAQDFSNSLQLKSKNILPEGLEYLDNTGIVISSLNYGSVYRVRDDGVIDEYFSASTLKHSAGLQVDNAHNRIYVCALDWPTQTTFGAVYSFSQSSRALKNVYDLSNLGPERQPKLINDVVQDVNGDLYTTDSLNGIIYYTSVSTNQSSVWLQSSVLLPQDELGLGINGIEYLPGKSGIDEDQLLFVRTGDSEAASGLFRVLLARDDPTLRIPIRIPIDDNTFDDVIGGFDGIVLVHGQGSIFITAPLKNKIFELHTLNRWQTAFVYAVYTSLCNTPTSPQYVQSPFLSIYAVCNNGFGDGPYAVERIPTEDFVYVVDIQSRDAASTVMCSVVLLLMVCFVCVF